MMMRTGLVWCIALALNVFAGTPEDLQRAAEFERIGDFESALIIFESVHGQAPDNGAAIEGLKRNYARLGRQDKLTGLYTELVARYPADAALALELADMLLGGEDGRRQADSLIAAAVAGTGDEAGYARAARVYVKHGLWEKALALYTGYRKRAGAATAFIEETAQANRRLGRYRAMAEEYVKLTEGLNQESYTYLTGMFERMGQDRNAYDALTDALRSAINGTPEDKRYLLYKLVRDLHMLSGDTDAAFEAVKSMETVSPRNGKDLNEFSHWCRNGGLHRAAMRADTYLIASVPESPFVPDAYFNRAMSAIALEDYDNGRALLDTVINRYPKHALAPQARYELGELYFTRLRQTGKAVEQYAYIVRTYPRSGLAVDALFRIGDCLVADGKLRKAERQYAELEIKARGNGENVNRARMARAEVLLMLKEFDAARKIADALAEERGTLYRNDALRLTLLLENDDKALVPYADALLAERQFNYTAARDAWQAMLPAAEGALNGQVRLKLAAAHVACGDADAAADVYRAFLREKGDSPLAAQAAFSLGRLLEEVLGDGAGAAVVYTDFLRDFPLSPLVPQVRRRLRNM